jgi:hypothetical protein
MDPRGPSRAPKHRKPEFAKTLKNHCFFMFLEVHGLPRQPLETQDGSQEALLGYLGILFGPAWGYLVLFGTILSHLGTILNHTPKINDSFTFLMVFNLQRVSLK